jgi:uncharacterized protein (DUF1684 family)
MPPRDAASLLAWRRSVSDIYGRVRRTRDPAAAHFMWRQHRDELFRSHPQSPLTPDDPLRRSGLPCWPYDPSLRFTAELQPAPREELREVPTSTDGIIRMSLAGVIVIETLGLSLDAWWLEQYAGGLFVPVRDATAGSGSYGGGRYLLDTAKGADLGTFDGRLVIDFNFLYHPSCRYNPVWECPLAPEGNTIRIPIEAGECLPSNGS